MAGTNDPKIPSPYEEIKELKEKLFMSVALLKALSERHKWNQYLGDCICEHHKSADEFILKIEALKKLGER